MKTFLNYELRTDGTIWNLRTQTQVKGAVGKNGYRTVTLYNQETKKAQNYYLHRLIATAFILNPNNYRYVDHVNENKLDNHVENLQWVTASQNVKKHYASRISPVQNKYWLYKNNSYSTLQLATYFKNDRLPKWVIDCLLDTGTLFEITYEEHWTLNFLKEKDYLGYQEFLKYLTNLYKSV